MKFNEQKHLENIYEKIKLNQLPITEKAPDSQSLNEGIFDDLKNTVSTMAAKAGGMASNVGNRVANVFRGGDTQKNPVEAQVQSIWNSFRKSAIGLVDQYLKKSAELIDFDLNKESLVSQQHEAITKAKDFLLKPQFPKDLKQNSDTNASAASSDTPATEAPPSSAPVLSVGDIESGNSSGSAGVTSAPTPDSGAGVVGTTPNNNSDPSSDAENNAKADSPSASPAKKNPAPRERTTNFLKFLKRLKEKNPKLYDELVKRVVSKLANPQTAEAPQPKSESFISWFNKDIIEEYASEIYSSSDKLLALFEYDVQQTIEKTKHPEGEDVRYHGAKPVIVEIQKFFKEFRRIYQPFKDALDKVPKMGEYNPTANRAIFVTIDAFVKQLGRILYIPGAENLQGERVIKK